MADLETLQHDAYTWFTTTFGDLETPDGVLIINDMFAPAERAVRAHEEIVETNQSLHVPVDTLIHNVLYTYARPVEPDIRVEVGGSLITLCLLAQSLNLNLADLGQSELIRVAPLHDRVRDNALRKVRDKTTLIEGAEPVDSKLVTVYALNKVRAYLGELREAGEDELVVDGRAAAAEDVLDELVRRLIP